MRMRNVWTFIFGLFLIAQSALVTGASLDTSSAPELYLAEKKGDVRVATKEDKGKGPKAVREVPFALGVNDRIVTGDKSRAYLQFRDGGSVEIGPKSDVAVSELKSGKDFKARFQLFAGKFKAIVRKLATPSSKFEVEAGGVVAGVRGTRFEVQNDPDTKTVLAQTYEGEIFTRVGSQIQPVKAGLSLAYGQKGEPLAGKVGLDDLKEFSDFVLVADDLEKRKQMLLQQLQKRILKPAEDKLKEKALDEGRKALKLPF
jgi:hypothetical protein